MSPSPTGSKKINLFAKKKSVQVNPQVFQPKIKKNAFA